MNIKPKHILVAGLGTLLIGGGVTTAFASAAGAAPVAHPVAAKTTSAATKTVDTPTPGDKADSVKDTDNVQQGDQTGPDTKDHVKDGESATK